MALFTAWFTAYGYLFASNYPTNTSNLKFISALRHHFNDLPTRIIVITHKYSFALRYLHKGMPKWMLSFDFLYKYIIMA